MATSSKTGPPLATFAILLAIVGALISEPGILAHTPDGSLHSAVGAVAMPSLGGHAAVPDALGLADGLLAELLGGSVNAPAASGTAPDTMVWYPPDGTTLPVVVPADPLPALGAGTQGDQSGGSTTDAIAPSPTPHPTTTPRSAAWKVAPIVTWYGPGFYGGRTACGQRYTRRIVGVASRTLPCGTLVEFRWRGITVVAPVIDRGPFGSSALVFDFSAQLACNLFRERGQRNGCYTRYHMQWRVVGRRRN